MDKKELDNLMALVQGGDETAFAELYEQTKKGLYSFLYAFVKDRMSAEDLLQETYIRVRKSAQSYTLGTNVTAWILQIGKNLALNEIEKRKRETLTDFSQLEIESDFSTEELADTTVYDTIVKQLDEQSARIVILHLVNGLKHREIAELLHLALGTVLWSYNTSIKKLKKILEKEGVR